MKSKFTGKSEECIREAIRIAEVMGHSYVGTEHLLMALVKNELSSTAIILSSYGVSYERVMEEVRRHAGVGTKSTLDVDDITPKCKKVLDYGCGKGRVSFFLSRRTGARTIGIEYDERIYRKALENNKTAVPRAKSEFVWTRAEEYAVPVDVSRCYFFNPFSVEILRQVMARILESYYDEPREILLFFYYPSDEFMCYLMGMDELDFYDEIDCDDLFCTGSHRERIMVFHLPGF